MWPEMGKDVLILLHRTPFSYRLLETCGNAHYQHRNAHQE